MITDDFFPKKILLYVERDKNTNHRPLSILLKLIVFSFFCLKGPHQVVTAVQPRENGYLKKEEYWREEMNESILLRGAITTLSPLFVPVPYSPQNR